jgi:hypothetical protein
MGDFNISEAILYKYADSVPVFSCQCAGTEQLQYDSIEWIDNIPNPLPTLQELIDIFPSADLKNRRLAVWDKVKEKRIQIIAGNVIYKTFEFQSDEQSQYKINLAASDGDLIYEWIDAHNIGRSLSKTDMIALRDLCLKLTELAYANSQTLRQQINNSDNPEEIDITVGWPPIPYKEV